MIFLVWVFCTVLAYAFAEPSPECIATSFSQISDIIENCDGIIIRNITVPGGNQINFELKDGASLTFEGRITFEYSEYPKWGSYLMRFYGNNLTVEGAPGSVLDGQGALYWDGIGGQGLPKPRFVGMKVTNSVFRNINLLNCPYQCVRIEGSDQLTLSGWSIDSSDGDDHGGHNTDGFGVTRSNNIVIKDSTVLNQDDCVAVNQGFNMSFSGLRCSGSHGISLSVGISKTSYLGNTVQNVTFSNCTLSNSINAIHIKTHNDGGPGEITDVTYENIGFTDIINFGISIQEDYASGEGTGVVKGNVPITNLKFHNIKGSLSSTSTNATQVYIFCAEDACSQWNWSEISISGGVQPSWCNFQPNGYKC